MKTLKDCADLYINEFTKREQLAELFASETIANEEKFTREAFEEIGLVPSSIEANSAFFEHDGVEIHLVVVRGKYGAKLFFRILDEKCHKCDMTLSTDQYDLTEENIGQIIVAPQKRYHDCPNWNVETIELTVTKEGSPREKFMDALDAYIREVGLGIVQEA